MTANLATWNLSVRDGLRLLRPFLSRTAKLLWCRLAVHHLSRTLVTLRPVAAAYHLRVDLHISRAHIQRQGFQIVKPHPSSGRHAHDRRSQTGRVRSPNGRKISQGKVLRPSALPSTYRTRYGGVNKAVKRQSTRSSMRPGVLLLMVNPPVKAFTTSPALLQVAKAVQSVGNKEEGRS